MTTDNTEDVKHFFEGIDIYLNGIKEAIAKAEGTKATEVAAKTAVLIAEKDEKLEDLRQGNDNQRKTIADLQSELWGDKRRIAKLTAALTKIANYDGESIWMDDRDDAAYGMLEVAKAALEGRPFDA